jgi:hypothetical protein
MKKILLALLFSVLAIVPVSAHELETDQNIGVLLHVEPDDSPIPGDSSTLVFTITDRDQKFSTEHCVCTVSIFKDDQQVTSGALTRSGADTGSFNFDFPEAATYTVKLAGSPATSDAFQTFQVEYSIESLALSTGNTYLLLWIGGGVVILILIAAAFFRKNMATTRQKVSHTTSENNDTKDTEV